MLVRFFGTAEVMDFGQSSVAMIFLRLVGFGLLGLAAYCADRISNRPSIRSKSYGYMMMLRAITIARPSSLCRAAVIDCILGLHDGPRVRRRYQGASL